METNIDDVIKSMTVSQPIYSTGQMMTIPITRVLGHVTSPHQEMLFVDTADFGRCLIIDGVVQTAESDHVIYDGELLRRMMDSDRTILILGGGDGYVAQTALACNAAVHVTIADLDEQVVEGCKTHLDQTVFDDARVTVHIGDALAYMRESDKKYDGIVCDLTDAPVGAKDVADFEKFFGEVIALASGCVRDGGWISVQAGASQVTDAYINSVDIVSAILKRHFFDVERRDVLIPSYGEQCAFLFGAKS